MSFIFSTHPLHPAARSMLEAAGDLRVASAPDPETLLREGRGAGILVIRAPIPPAYFEDAPALRAAIRHGAGLDMVPMDAATRAGVLVANVPGANASTVAEHVFLVTLALLRRFRLMDRELRQNGWVAGRARSDAAVDLAGRTIGIVGMGNVGKAIFKIAKFGFGLEVVATSRSPESVPDGVRFLTIDELVATADIVVLCCPLTPETTGLLNAGRIGRMKPAAILVNVSRGPVIDDAALVEALRDGRVGGAALDVFATQPLPLDHPYFGFDNVIVTPHLAGLTEESMMRMGTGAASEALRVIKGDLPVNLCNPEVVEHYRRRFPA
ncbi:hydroxyacid dehydrogenase [Rhizobium leguminosarum]|uniref:D-isomer specific 2-hydroxyacid dehydrogenase NAD-binding n=1 Tax=Rhizobium leguminosarum bv. trifolii (strain WSM1325) TaxID=395491 RepID=C6B539_RHILS|nr:hydroxyacid dehydrogenase [Rhizobium leguminosarum]ACS59197.1 D-isomer specific 2-hydroxyacid dehydrogenase NAD-binding [Rhizobium leguminosarum bv. trifolii WSM1325]MBY2915907.1 hydroxyacid dehydrogenase [Rhizobium leguminosarum]MBY2933707.1 hydroxyacid dehydrogenase [Rhizobium leguminosarum]MBY2948806.1 hydroxyacid dehydrogenase [Rhizobium leguminosarum]MBY2971142.1 hydroxyacid dehydrogenase [Rhizobium leguminosarum]